VLIKTTIKLLSDSIDFDITPSQSCARARKNLGPLAVLQKTPKHQSTLNR